MVNGADMLRSFEVHIYENKNEINKSNRYILLDELLKNQNVSGEKINVE